MSSTETVVAPDVAQLQTALEEVIGRLAAMQPEDTPEEVVQLLLTVAAKRYAAARRAGRDFGPFVHDEALNATEVMVTVMNMLYAAEIEVFELAMWAMPGYSGVEESETS